MCVFVTEFCFAKLSERLFDEYIANDITIIDKTKKIFNASRLFDMSYLFLKYSNFLNGSSHILMRMEKFWSYFCFGFPNAHKTFKRIKKAANIVKYEAAVNENFQRLTDHEEDQCSENP